MEYPHFKEALLSLGSNDTERVQRLNIPRRVYYDLKAGRFTSQIKRILHPELLRALAEDVENTSTKPTDIAA